MKGTILIILLLQLVISSRAQDNVYSEMGEGNQNSLTMFADVKAFALNQGVRVEWTNLTERTVVSYIIQRSLNGSDFSNLGLQLPAFNQNDKAAYSFFDSKPLPGINFYRILVNENLGKLIYSKVLRVELKKEGEGFSIYPNPVNGKQFTISVGAVKPGDYQLKLIATTGQIVYQQPIKGQGNSFSETIELPSGLPPGVYAGSLTGNEYKASKLIVIR